jgi:hypothetical protein
MNADDCPAGRRPSLRSRERSERLDPRSSAFIRGPEEVTQELSMRTTHAVAMMMVALPASLLSGQERRAFNGDTFEWSERVPRGAWLRVYDPNGRIEVTEASGDVAEVRAERREGRRDAVQIEIRRDGDDVTICAVVAESDCDDDGVRTRRRSRSRDDDDRARIHFTVRLPRGVRLAAGTGNGEVSVTGAAADVQASSGNGRVRVSTSSGAVRASSGNGEVSVEGATDRVSASSGNGRVTVATRRGPVQASSGNGDIDVRMQTLASDEDMSFSTGNGRITVAVPPDFTGEIDGTLGHGSFRSDFPVTLQGRFSPTRVRGTIGSGGPRVRMMSGNGDIELVKVGTRDER